MALFQYDKLHRLTKVHWGRVALLAIVIESIHSLGNESRLILRGTTGVPLLPDQPDTPFIGVLAPPTVDDRYPHRTPATDDPPLVFPPDDLMKAFYWIWHAAKTDFPVGDPADRSSIQSYILNFDRVPASFIVPIKLRMKYSIPIDVTLGTRITVRAFDHFDFKLVTTSQPGPAIRAQDGKADPLLLVQKDLNADALHPFKELDIEITRLPLSITLTGIP